MPANVKRSENLEKHQTKAELQARQAAEAAILPDRAGSPKPPRTLNKYPAAKRYWKSILERMEGLAILELVNKLDTILSKLQAHEKILLSFADKLGMTPEARVRLARRRAAQAVQLDPDGDLFGD